MDIKTQVLEASLKIGQAQKLFSLYESLIGDLPAVGIQADEKIRNNQLSETERNGYILFPLIPGYTSLCLRFCILGYAFRNYGYEPIILYDDDDLPARPELTVDTNDPLRTVEISRYRSRNVPRKFDFECISIGELNGSNYEPPDIETKDSSNPYLYKDMDISGAVAASTRKYLKRYTLEPSDAAVRDSYRDFLRSGMMLADATKAVISEYNPEIAIVNESNYIQGWVPLKICENADIPVYTQAKGYHEGQIAFGRTTNKNHRWNFTNEALTSKALEKPLSTEQRETIHDIMMGRETGEVTPVQYTSDSSSSVDVSESRIVGVFSHLLWDGALEPNEALYDDFYDWLDDTIRIGAELDETHFVIKAHPAESIRGTNESVIDWLEENHDPLPDNFTALPPDTDVNTYELFRDLDAGVVYASTVGLEMAFRGIPVLVGGFPPYHGFGLSYDPSSKSKYEERLREIGELSCTEEMQRRAERFAHYFFVCKHLDFPYLSEWSESSDAITIEHEAIAQENGPYDRIVKQILNDEEVIEPGCMSLK